jgi:hypothetical protein
MKPIDARPVLCPREDWKAKSIGSLACPSTAPTETQTEARKRLGLEKQDFKIKLQHFPLISSL